MAVKVFLLGRPGSGKTTAFHVIKTLADKEGWYTKYFREYEILYEMYKFDTQDKFKCADHGGFEVRDFSVLEISAKHLEDKVNDYLSTASKDEIVCIELARDDYKKAMHFFSSEFLLDAYFLFIEVDVETCIRRIHHRVKYASTSGHFVPDNILRSYYAENGFKYMTSFFKEDYKIQKEVKTILNDRSAHDFSEEVKSFARTIFTSKLVAAQK